MRGVGLHVLFGQGDGVGDVGVFELVPPEGVVDHRPALSRRRVEALAGQQGQLLIRPEQVLANVGPHLVVHVLACVKEKG